MTSLERERALEIEMGLSTPSETVIAAVKRLNGDFAVLGVGGKMGTTTALMLRRALDQAGKDATRVYGVSRFSRPEGRALIEKMGIRTVSCDLSDAEAVSGLPAAANILFLAGQKFGTESRPEATWIQNTIVPSLVAQKYRGARTVAFSTGCVYPFASVLGPGSRETDPVAFNGEYASSCVGRERVFSYYADKYKTPLLLFRLNYAVELRYGVLVDIATKVWRNEAVDVTTGHLNCIWQGDACGLAIASLERANTPPEILNVTGPEILSVRALAGEFGRRFGRSPLLTGTEAETAWISDAGEMVRRFGRPETSLPTMLDRVAEYISGGGALLGKPTHFETRSGNF